MKKRDELADFVARDSAKSFARAQKFHPAFGAVKCGIGRRLEKKGLKVAGEFF